MSLRHRHADDANEPQLHSTHADLVAQQDVEDPKVHSTRRPIRPNGREGNNTRLVSSRRQKKRRLRQKHRLNAMAYVRGFLLLVMVVTLLGGGYVVYHFVLYPRVVHPPKLQSLPDDFQVSAVLMNHYRPRMIRQSSLLPTLLQHKHVGEILLCHSNPNTTFQYHHPKVRNLDAVASNQERGLSLRFYFCYTEARYEYVIIVDDDQEVTTTALDTLLETFALHPDRIVGRYGRTYSPYWSRRTHGYNTRTVFGQVEVVLTKLLVAPRASCGHFLQYESLVMEDLVRPQSHPLWNGEDIFFSLVSNHVHGVPPDGPYRNLAVFFGGVSEASNALKDDDAGGHDVSGNMDRHAWYRAVWTHDSWVNYTAAAQRARNHTAYRGTLWAVAKERLAQLSAKEEGQLELAFHEKYGQGGGGGGNDVKEAHLVQDL